MFSIIVAFKNGMCRIIFFFESICVFKKKYYLCTAIENSMQYIGVVVQLVRIPACHAGGRGFESRPFRQLFLFKSSYFTER